jgi:hypothetical protein
VKTAPLTVAESPAPVTSTIEALAVEAAPAAANNTAAAYLVKDCIPTAPFVVVARGGVASRV